jgi:hypothetical protein
MFCRWNTRFTNNEPANYPTEGWFKKTKMTPPKNSTFFTIVGYLFSNPFYKIIENDNDSCVGMFEFA